MKPVRRPPRARVVCDASERHRCACAEGDAWRHPQGPQIAEDRWEKRYRRHVVGIDVADRSGPDGRAERSIDVRQDEYKFGYEREGDAIRRIREDRDLGN